MIATDLSVHLTRQTNLNLLRRLYDGLKVTVVDKLSDERHTSYSFESPHRHKVIMIQLPSDVELEADELKGITPLRDFYASHKRAVKGKR